MSNLNLFALFGIMFLSSVLLGSGTFMSNQTSILAQENEAEVEVDIEQENKCKNDTECKNENEINNSLTITATQGQEEQPETSPCEDCFDIVGEGQIDNFLAAFIEAVQQQISTLEELCQYIDENQGTLELNEDLLTAAMASINEDQYNDLILCLQDAGLDVDFPFA